MRFPDSLETACPRCGEAVTVAVTTESATRARTRRGLVVNLRIFGTVLHTCPDVRPKRRKAGASS